MAARRWRNPMATGSFDQLAALRHALGNPAASVDSATLVALFRIETVRVEAARPLDFQDFPDLAVRVRGAMGTMLYRMGPPPPARAGGSVSLRAWDVVMEPFTPAAAKPSTVFASAEGNRVIAGVNLIGHAAFWRPDIEAALVAAFDAGMKLNGEGQVLARLPVLGCVTTVSGGFDLPAVACRSALLCFTSPVRLRAGGSTLISGPSFLIALANRVKNLGMWLGLKLEEDWPSLHRAAWAIETDCAALTPYRWDRGSRRAKGRIPVLGFLGTMRLSGNLDRFVPYLLIGEAMNAGSHAALGLGRYRLALMP